MKDKLIKLFTDKHGEPDNIEKLDMYLDFLLSYDLEESDYTEKHHILDRASFPEFENSNWNLVELAYDDHILAHELLFEAYNIRRYGRTLNFKGVKKDSKLISNAAKKGWKKLKKDKEKYKEWNAKRIQYLKSLPKEYYSDKANLFWDNITEEEKILFSKKVKKSKTPKVIQKQKESLQKYYEDPKNREEKSNEAQLRWDSMTEEEREDFNKKMKTVNSDIEKRKDAGEKIKKKWKDPLFLEKMKNRKTKTKNKYQLIFEDGTIDYIEGVKEMVEKYNLNITLIRKFLNTNTKVTTKSKREDALNTVGLIVNQL